MDAYRLEPTESHDIINDTHEPVDIVFIKDRLDPKDKISVKG